ncbi:MAG: DUF1933 domain-containing protein [Candidatus Krumholzibacteriota bacterium]|nr:DUF1933 domain-containing protein [Candidatus Krumholzibacteriota bacterium]
MVTGLQIRTKGNMPGIHFIHDTGSDLKGREPLLLQTVKSLLHEEWFRQRILLTEDDTFLCYTYHPAYPVEIFENDDLLISIEGRLYGEDPAGVESKIRELTGYMFDDGDSGNGSIGSWIGSVEGDFVIFAKHKPSGRICIANDALGRLPLYYSRIGKRLIVSREMRFITDIFNDRCFDRTALAQYLLLGYMPGGKTLIENISRLEPASLVRIDPVEEKSEISSLFQYDFSDKELEGSSLDSITEGLTEIFYRACGDRAGRDGTNILSLSGGLDSRALAAGLCGMDLSFRGVTFLDHYKTAALDISIAEKIASTMGFDWHLFDLGPPTGSDLLRLLRSKSGMNSLGMGFSIPLFDQLRSRWGEKITFFTGEGGEILKPDSRPYKKMKDIDDLTNHLLERNSILSLEQTAAVTGIESDYIYGSIRDYLEQTPENDLAMKYLHFMVCGRNLKWTSEGEDRNRFFLWTVSPFFSPRFFRYVMSIPESAKSNYKLYRSFLMRISPRTAAIDNANWNLPIMSNRYMMYIYGRKLFYRLPPSLKLFIRKRMKHSNDLLDSYQEGSALMKCFREQAYGCEAVGDYLSSKEIEALLPGLNKSAFDHIFTLTSLIEDITTGTSSLSRYLDNDLT